MIGVHLDALHGSLVQDLGVRLAQVAKDSAGAFAENLQHQLHENVVVVVQTQEINEIAEDRLEEAEQLLDSGDLGALEKKSKVS